MSTPDDVGWHPFSVRVVEELPRAAASTEDGEFVILGAGISGMLAAKACTEHGRSFVLVDKGPPGALPRIVKGCVYLHDPCGMEGKLRTQELATSVLHLPGQDLATLARQYHRKIWGETIPYEANSIDKFVGTSTIWSMNDALAYLHGCFADYVALREVGWDDVQGWLKQGRRVISTVPLWALFPNLRLEGVPLWTWQVEGGGDSGQVAHTMYNVDPLTDWYRMTSMFGNLSVEFCRSPGSIRGVYQFRKIRSYDMRELDSMHPNLLFTGRWGRWERGFLSHQTYRVVTDLLQGRWSR